MGRHQRIAEPDLIKLLVERNKQGIEILYDNYSSALYGVIYRIVQNDEIAEDVMQEAFVKIWNNFSQYDATKGRLFTWIVNLARNLAIDKVRSKDFINSSKNQDIANIVSFIDMGSNHSYNPELIGLRELVRKLDPEHKEVIDLLYFSGYTQSEAAEKLNIPLGTVKTRARNAIMKLRKEFGFAGKN